MTRKKPEMTILSVHLEPKTGEEALEAERRLIAAYDLLFEEVEKKRA